MFNKIFPGTLTHDNRKVSIKECKWKTESSGDPEVIANWQKNYGHKIKYWGVPTGSQNGIIVLDVDVKGGGLDTVKKYHIPKTLSQTTLSGGKHYVFKLPQDGNRYQCKVGIDAGLDVRAEDGYIFSYDQWDNCPIAEAPEWLLESCRDLRGERVEVNPEDAIKIDHVVVNDILVSACENIRQAPEGSSNDILNVESYRVGQLVTSGSLDRKIAFDELFKAAKDRGKPNYEAKATIDSGLEGGSRNPLTCPFGNEAPVLSFTPIETEDVNTRWTPRFMTDHDLTNFKKLRKEQLFKNWITRDISLLTADGGTGKTTLKLNEAICLALGQPFLGFECKKAGRTLFITGEDDAGKLYAMVGAICKQMGLMDGNHKEEMSKIKNNVIIKADTDLCLTTKEAGTGFIMLRPQALVSLTEAIEDLRPDMIIFDPIASFWGSEAGLNDMAKVVTKFMGVLVNMSNACVEMINHMGKDSSSKRDLSQFAGRGGSALPSHSRVSKVLAPLSDEQYTELTGGALPENRSAMICNVNKFSDGSPLLNKPFVIMRNGWLFEKVEIVEQIEVEKKNENNDQERILQFITNERAEQRYPTAVIITEHFKHQADKIPASRTKASLASLVYFEKIKLVENIDAEVRDRMYILRDESV